MALPFAPLHLLSSRYLHTMFHFFSVKLKSNQLDSGIYWINTSPSLHHVLANFLLPSVAARNYWQQCSWAMGCLRFIYWFEIGSVLLGSVDWWLWELTICPWTNKSRINATFVSCNNHHHRPLALVEGGRSCWWGSSFLFTHNIPVREIVLMARQWLGGPPQWLVARRRPLGTV